MSLRPNDMALQATSRADLLDMTNAAATDQEPTVGTEQLQLTPKVSDEIASLNPKGSPTALRRPKYSTRLQQQRSYNFGLFMLRFVSTEQESFLIDESGNEQTVPARQDRYDFRLAQWLMTGAFSWQSSCTYGSWKYSFRTFRYIPKDSLVVDFCQQGDLANVQKMFAKGLASPFDRVRTDVDGDWSLLHVGVAILPT